MYASVRSAARDPAVGWMARRHRSRRYFFATGFDAPSSPEAMLIEAFTSEGQRHLVQVTRDGRKSFVHYKGQVREASLGSDSKWTISSSVTSFEPTPESRLVLSSPLISLILPKLHAHSAVSELNLSQGMSLSPVYSLSDLEDSVKSNPSFWVDGTKPGARDKSDIESETMTAGELLCLLSGSRGVSTVQIYNGWDIDRGQPLYQPWVLDLIEQCLAHPDLSFVISTAPSDKDEVLGITLILFANKEPFSSYAKHLASFGFQSNIVAGSPFFKLLCGILLGYELENCRSYVRSTSPPGSLTPLLISQVDAEVKKLSKVKPKLPWTSKQGSRGKKAKE